MLIPRRSATLDDYYFRPSEDAFCQTWQNDENQARKPLNYERHSIKNGKQCCVVGGSSFFAPLRTHSAKLGRIMKIKRASLTFSLHLSRDPRIGLFELSTLFSFLFLCSSRYRSPFSAHLFSGAAAAAAGRVSPPPPTGCGVVDVVG